jgi:hypothetical protein
MTVAVSPAEFRFVLFDADEIGRVATGVLAALGMSDHSLAIEVDETTPLARIRASSAHPIVVQAESGAFEDTRRPRHFSENATMISLGRVLLRARDRLAGGFADAPADESLTLAQTAAWDTYCIGRVARLGVEVNQQRWRYNFRNRHGFSDRADEVFDHLWASDGLTWTDLDSMSQQAATR